jgi:hypothetical protein
MVLELLLHKNKFQLASMQAPITSLLYFILHKLRLTVARLGIRIGFIPMSMYVLGILAVNL